MKKSMTRRSFAGLTAVAGMSALLVGCGSDEPATDEPVEGGDAPAPAKLRFVTGGESGTYYAFGSVIA